MPRTMQRKNNDDRHTKKDALLLLLHLLGKQLSEIRQKKGKKLTRKNKEGNGKPKKSKRKKKNLLQWQRR